MGIDKLGSGGRASPGNEGIDGSEGKLGSSGNTRDTLMLGMGIDSDGIGGRAHLLISSISSLKG